MQIFTRISQSENVTENVTKYFVENFMKFMHISRRFQVYLMREYAQGYVFRFLVSLCVPKILCFLLIIDLVSVSFSVVHVCQVVIQSIPECIDGGRLHNMRRTSVSVVDNSLGKEISKNVEMRRLLVFV